MRIFAVLFFLLVNVVVCYLVRSPDCDIQRVEKAPLVASRIRLNIFKYFVFYKEMRKEFFFPVSSHIKKTHIFILFRHHSLPSGNPSSASLSPPRKYLTTPFILSSLSGW